MNATAMMKPFPEKRMNNFTRIKSTLEYVNALHEEKAKAPISALADSELVTISKGGNESGTWFHEDLAIYFAQWLNPKFGVWCNKRIQEILTKGFSALTEGTTSYIEKKLSQEVRLVNEIINQIIPKAKR